ncbi:MAG: AAA family ATPase [Firmicutes bacterium]|nr:AAA family ATPase [Bacillota bacterium]
MKHSTEVGARWLRCDLHVHTPFDPTKSFSVDVEAAKKADEKGDSSRLTDIARRFVEAVDNAADGAGLDVVAITDHNSIDGFRYLKSHFEVLLAKRAEEGKRRLTILPGVEFGVGSEQTIHFLAIFAANTDLDQIDHLIDYIFGHQGRFNPTGKTPLAANKTIGDFLEDFHKFAHPVSRERYMEYVLIPAHLDGNSGVARETGAQEDPHQPTVWDQMSGYLRERGMVRTDWHAFQASGDFSDLRMGVKELLYKWQANRENQIWEKLSPEQKERIKDRKHRALINASDPDRFEAIGRKFTYLKMEVPDVEGLRLAFLDPESRLRLMAEGVPKPPHAAIRSISIRNTKFFGELDCRFNSGLNTLIGGRGTGKSTLLEYLRYVLGRDLEQGSVDAEQELLDRVQEMLSLTTKKGLEEKATLLPDHYIEVEIIVDGRLYRVRRDVDGLKVYFADGSDSGKECDYEVRALLPAKIYSQKQIFYIAKDPAAQRRELDKLVEVDQWRRIEEQIQDAIYQYRREQNQEAEATRKMSQLATKRTDLEKISSRIALLEQGGRQELLQNFKQFEDERRILNELGAELQERKKRLEDLTASLPLISTAAAVSEDSPFRDWLQGIFQRVDLTINKCVEILREQGNAVQNLHDSIIQEQKQTWEPAYRRCKNEYDLLAQELDRQGLKFTEHATLLQQRALLEKEIQGLQELAGEIEKIHSRKAELRSKLLEFREQQAELRRNVARRLEGEDADIRVKVNEYMDRKSFVIHKDDWFARTRLREDDWDLLCNYVFEGESHNPPAKLAALVECLRADLALLEENSGLALEQTRTYKLIKDFGDGQNLSGHFLNVIKNIRPETLDEMEIFLPEDLIRSELRDTSGSFRSIEQGSVGQKSTAILSLLLSSGNEPLIIDQPEDDLDNQYIYDIVVNLLRKRKFERQLIIATHNANIPVNGDAELIIGLDAEGENGEIRVAGSIDNMKVKEMVSRVMEGSREAFRLRRQRYGF